MANIGDKYIIEIQNLGMGNDTYYLKNSVLNHSVVSGRALQGFEKYDPESEYQRGLNDAWEAAKKIINLPRDGGLTVYDLKNIFGIDYDDPERVLKDFKGESAVKRIATYEAKKQAEEIKVGDEITVRVHSPERTINVIVYDVLMIGSTMVYDTLSFGEGKCFKISWNPEIKKTGRHFHQVAELLKAMEEGGETNA